MGFFSGSSFVRHIRESVQRMFHTAMCAFSSGGVDSSTRFQAHFRELSSPDNFTVGTKSALSGGTTTIGMFRTALG
jgi:asparagine synthetase B (glutamine-hydrolysing)